MKTTRMHKIEKTQAEFDAQNDVIPKGHMAKSTDSDDFRIGDGESTYDALPVFSPYVAIP